MRRRTVWLTGALAIVLGASVLGVQQCRWEPEPITAFGYGSHERPRVFVSHHPLVPTPGSRLLVRLAPDLPANVAVTVARATLSNANGGVIETRDCAASGAIFECQFTLPAAESLLAYAARLELSNADVVHSRTSYRFTVATALAPDALVPVRVPAAPNTDLAESYRVDTAFVRDPQDYASDTFAADVELNLFDGILRDPAYRWRDDQLGFFVFARPGLVTSYYSARDTRCGKNPWPRDAAFPPALGDIETLGVLHRKATTPDGIEGRVTAPVGANVFRDCAGRAVKRTDVGTFSATAGLAESALVVTHEFGHAAFGQGDEYTEPDATRRVAPASPFPPGECCCVDDSSSGGGGGGGIDVVPVPGGVARPRNLGIDTMRCVSADGSIRQLPINGSPPACGENNSGLADACFSGPDDGCPPLAGDCITASHWLGTAASATTARPNVFTTEAACQAAAPAAADHPGVEEPTRSLATCREICGPTTSPCPCGVSESWIVDRNPAETATAADVMGAGSPGALHGGTCIWCVETTLCVRWQRALGEGADEAWRACEAPPKEATRLERWSRAVTAAIGSVLDRLLRAIRF